MTSLEVGTSWRGQLLLVVPVRSGHIARTKCFQQRFTACSDLGILHDPTSVGQHLCPAKSADIPTMLDASVVTFIRSHANHCLREDSDALEEVHARISFQWLLNDKPKSKTLATIDGHLNLDSYLPLYISAIELGMKVIVLDRPEHWIAQPSMRRYYQDFIPIDMTPDDESHIRIASAIKSYGHVDGLCAIAIAFEPRERCCDLGDYSRLY